jgi:hypothetical protein
MGGEWVAVLPDLMMDDGRVGVLTAHEGVRRKTVEAQRSSLASSSLYYTFNS